jgi:uncharacterized damage-inducible protein DinB
MLSKDDASRLLDYTAWANHKVMRVAATLSPDDFRRDLNASHGGVRGTLAHMMSAEWLWLERWKGVSPTRLLDEGEFADVVALRDHWTAIEEHRRAWFEALRPDALAEDVHYRNMKGVAQVLPLWQMLQHVANHATYHRGQVIVLLRLLGAKPVTTDMVYWDLDRERKEIRDGERA